MGVPGFYRWLIRRYPEILVEKKAKYDALYLDMNAIIHPCCQGQTDEKSMFANVWKAVDKLVDMVRPTILLYLAIDGVAPRAKMNQQRTRRFRTAKENSTKWDTNQITPGTPFMSRLSNSLQQYITMKQYPFSVILSDSSVPGEGEHKIMKFLRFLKARGGSFAHHCMFGGDADLFMLALLTEERSFTILREDPNASMNHFHWVDLQVLRGRLLNDLGYHRESIQDFIVLCFLAGNDFLPSISRFEIGQGILVRLMQHYRRFPVKLTDANGLQQFLRSYSKTNYDANDKTYDPHQCQAYYQAVNWTYLYYTRGCPSWTWFYPYHYAPTLNSLLYHSLAPNTPPFELGSPFPEILQLAAVQPRTSLAACLPAKLASHLSSKSEFYPVDFEVDTTGKRFEWQGVVLLPFIDIRKLSQLITEICPLVSNIGPIRIYNSTGTFLLADES